jgi:hypothetical protein
VGKTGIYPNGGDQGGLWFMADVTQQLGHETLLNVNKNGKSAIVRIGPTKRFEIGETRDSILTETNFGSLTRRQARA